MNKPFKICKHPVTNPREIVKLPKHKHKNVNRNFWRSEINQRKFFDDLGQQIGIQTLSDWYEKLSYETIIKHGGRSLLSHYKNSPQAALTTIYHEHEWIPWKFGSVPKGFWNEVSNQMWFFDYLGQQLGIQSLDDWYQKLSFESIVKNGGSGLLMLPQYKNSPANALMNIYPAHNWIPWKFTIIPRSCFKTSESIGQFLAELSDKLSIQTLDDWYRVDWRLLHTFGATPILRKHKGLYNFLKQQYPNHPWDPKKFQVLGKKSQRWLVVNLRRIFPDDEILEDYIHPKGVFSLSKRPLQLDVFIPSRSLAFEYQGIHHYKFLFQFGDTNMYHQRDEEKRLFCVANNIKLVEVPYWWNRTQEALEQIISNSKN